jgi:uncharacterized membrane protein
MERGTTTRRLGAGEPRTAMMTRRALVSTLGVVLVAAAAAAPAAAAPPEPGAYRENDHAGTVRPR